MPLTRKNSYLKSLLRELNVWEATSQLTNKQLYHGCKRSPCSMLLQWNTDLIKAPLYFFYLLCSSLAIQSYDCVLLYMLLHACLMASQDFGMVKWIGMIVEWKLFEHKGVNICRWPDVTLKVRPYYIVYWSLRHCGFTSVWSRWTSDSSGVGYDSFFRWTHGTLAVVSMRIYRC